MAKTKTLVSVIIPNFNREKFLERCLKSIFQKKGGYEVIVVDDGSTDGSLNLLDKKFKQEKKLKVIALGQNLGAAQARNIGAQNSTGKYLLFLDNDTKIKKDWFGEVLRFFAHHKKAGIAQAKILKMGTNKFDYAGDLISPFGFLIERARSAEDKGQFDKEEKIFALKSAAMLARKDVYKKLGGFDADYKIFWEDTDIAWRTWLWGYQVLFTPQIVVWHAYGTGEKEMEIYIRNQVVYRGCKNMITTLIKNLETKKALTILPLNVGCWFILSILFLLKLDLKRSSAILRGILWNFINYPKTLKKRKLIQSKRKICDQELFLMVGTKKNIAYYLGKAFAYIMGRPF